MAETDFEILDPQFKTLVKTSAVIEKLWSGGRWTEGPAYFLRLNRWCFPIYRMTV